MKACQPSATISPCIFDSELDELLVEIAWEQRGVEKRIEELQDALEETQKPIL